MTDRELIENMFTEMNDLKSQVSDFKSQINEMHQLKQQVNQLQIFIHEKFENNDQSNTNTDTNTNINTNTLNVNMQLNSDLNDCNRDENTFDNTSNTSGARIMTKNNNTNTVHDLSINEKDEKINHNDNQVTSTNIHFKSGSKSTSTVEQENSKHDEHLEIHDPTLGGDNEIKNTEDWQLEQDVKTDGKDSPQDTEAVTEDDDSVEIVMDASVSPQIQPQAQPLRQVEEQQQWKRQEKRTITTQHDEFVCDERNRLAAAVVGSQLELELMGLELKEEKEENLVSSDNGKDFHSSVSINISQSVDSARQDRVEQDRMQQDDVKQGHVDTGSKRLMIDMQIIKSQSSISMDQQLLANSDKNNNNSKKIINLAAVFNTNQKKTKDERNNSNVDYKMCEKYIFEEMKGNYKYFEFCQEISKFDQMFKERHGTEDWQQNVKIVHQADHIVATFLINHVNGSYLENIDHEMKHEAKNQLYEQLNHPSDFRLTPTLFNSCKRVSCKDICFFYCFDCFYVFLYRFAVFAVGFFLLFLQFFLFLTVGNGIFGAAKQETETDVSDIGFRGY